MLAGVVERVDHPAPAALGLRARRRACRPGQAVRARIASVGLREMRKPVRPDQSSRHGRGTYDLEAERLRFCDAVPVRRENRLRRLGSDDPVVEEREGVSDCARASGIGRPVQQVSVEGHRARASGVQRGSRYRSQADEHLRELEVRHADAVAALAPVDDDEDEPPVRELADARARVARVDLARAEVLQRLEDRCPVTDDHRPPADRIDDGRPVWTEDEPDEHVLADGGLGGQAARPRPAGDEDRPVARDRGPSSGRDLRDHAYEVGRGSRRGERLEHDFDSSGSARRGRAPHGGEERHALGARSLVQAVQRPERRRSPATGRASTPGPRAGFRRR